MPEAPASATERCPHHLWRSGLYEFFEWHYSVLGVPWRDGTWAEEYATMLAAGWAVHAHGGNMVVLFRERPPEPEPPPKPASDFPTEALPDDLADAYESMKLALMRHRAERWFHVLAYDAQRMLDALKTHCYHEEGPRR
jgi:hypothetical protein